MCPVSGKKMKNLAVEQSLDPSAASEKSWQLEQQVGILSHSLDGRHGHWDSVTMMPERITPWKLNVEISSTFAGELVS